MAKRTLQARIKVLHDTCSNWAKIDHEFIPMDGEIIIYDDYKSIEIDNQVKWIPGIKIGSGNAYLVDIAFLDEEERLMLEGHINNDVAHVSFSDRERWDNKLNYEINNENLIFNRI